MRIQHNIMALNSQRQLGINNSNISKSLEKLSSGYRINRAGDDAAGLAISEKMRAQIKGLETATDNANDAISLIQTAEGGLQEVHSMLNRMTELATKSSNGTYDDTVDRLALKDEYDALSEEIDRISNTTNFNGIKLLDGSLNNGMAKTFTVDGTDLTLSAGAGIGTSTIEFKDGSTIARSVGVKIDAATGNVEITLGTKDAKETYTAEDIQEAVRSEAQSMIDGGLATTADAKNALSALTSFKVEGNITMAKTTAGTAAASPLAAVAGNKGGLVFQIGETKKDNELELTIEKMDSVSLGLDVLKIDKRESASNAMDGIKKAINRVSTQRGKLGAIQNRLEHTINNLGVTTENITAAESRIRDVDMAKEMMTFTKNSVLQQSAQAMLAQANQQPQSVLQLLQ